MASDRLEDLHPKVKEMAREFLCRCKEVGLDVVIYNTLRTKEEQDELYAQGRTKPGKIITYAKGGYSFHNYGLAFDAGPRINGKIAWKRIDLFKKMGAIGKSVGLIWGGDWEDFRDYPHFQWSDGLEIEDLVKGKCPGKSDGFFKDLFAKYFRK